MTARREDNMKLTTAIKETSYIWYWIE
jgi:hypothetical protein